MPLVESPTSKRPAAKSFKPAETIGREEITVQTLLPTNETMTTQAWDGFFGKLLRICIALTVSLLAAELVQVNRFLRTVIQGRAFWYYLLVLLVALGLLLGATLKKGAESQTESLIKLLAVGILFGFLGSVIAISATPLLVSRSLSPTISAWKDPSHLIAAAFVALGWVYGALAQLTVYFIHRGRYRHIGILMLACAAIRLLEMLPIGRLIQH